MKLCSRGYQAARRKFKVYPSAYANAYASKVCSGKVKGLDGKRKRDWSPRRTTKKKSGRRPSPRRKSGRRSTKRKSGRRRSPKRKSGRRSSRRRLSGGKSSSTKKKRKSGRKWSQRYKKSINCRNPKGFSQKQYCKYGRKKKSTKKRK